MYKREKKVQWLSPLAQKDLSKFDEQHHNLH